MVASALPILNVTIFASMMESVSPKRRHYPRHVQLLMVVCAAMCHRETLAPILAVYSRNAEQ